MRLFKVPIPRFRHRPLLLPKPGSPPGTLAVPPDLPPPKIWHHRFNAEKHEAAQVDLEELAAALAPEPGGVLWVDIQGLGSGEVVRQAGEALGLHPLTVEDVVHLHQRPKVEEFKDYLYVVMRAVRLGGDGRVCNEQLSFVLKEGVLVTFQEHDGDGFEPVRLRLREGKGQLRQEGADYLTYALMDTAIDSYFPVLELYGDTMDALDEQVRQDPSPAASAAVHAIRRELRQLRRAIWPLRDVAGTLCRFDHQLLSAKARPMFRDCYDHVVQVADFVDGTRERASELADLYLVMMSERTNQVMKVLTIIATIFIPLTFIAGIYGMNFDLMPELKWRWGYAAVWAAMTVITVFMLVLFRRAGWLGGTQEPPGEDTR